MQRILFPIDGSDASASTMHWASRFLKKQQADIYLLIVAESLDIDYSIESMQRILAEAERWFKHHGFRVEKADYITNRKAPEAICQYADGQGIDQIIIGSHGNRLAQFIIGSVSREVMQKAKQSVIVIQNTRLSPLAITEPELINLEHRPDEPLRTLLPVDSAYAGELALEMMGALLRVQDQLHIVHVISEWPKEREKQDRVLHDAHLLLETNRSFLEKDGCRVEKMDIRFGEPAEQICRYADENAMDQIVVASRNRSNIEKFLMGSVSSQVFNQARQPVLMFSLGAKTVLSISHSDDLALAQSWQKPST